MKVAFWNVNMGVESPGTKKKVFTNWVAAMRPDLLILEEVSAALAKGLTDTRLSRLASGEEESSYLQINYVNTLDRNLEESTKCLVALCSKDLWTNLSPAATALSLPDSEQSRMTIKVTAKAWGGFSIYGLHANASNQGGADAVLATRSLIGENSQSFVGGDFNCPLERAAELLGGSSVTLNVSLAWTGSALPFTYWRKGSGAEIAAGTYLNSRSIAGYSIEAVALYDYLCVPSSLGGAVRCMPNCTEAAWSDILAQFDHCPVLYEIN